MHSRDQQGGSGENLCEGRAVHNGVFPLAVLDDVGGEVEEVQTVVGVR